MNKAIKILIITVIVGLTISTIGCLGLSQKITQEDFNREASRWWVIYYKMLEDDYGYQTNEFITGTDGVEETLENEYGINFTKRINGANPNLKEQYYYMKRRNELMEEALIKFKREKALKEIEGKYSLEEAYGSLEEANKAINLEHKEHNATE